MPTPSSRHEGTPDTLVFAPSSSVPSPHLFDATMKRHLSLSLLFLSALLASAKEQFFFARQTHPLQNKAAFRSSPPERPLFSSAKSRSGFFPSPFVSEPPTKHGSSMDSRILFPSSPSRRPLPTVSRRHLVESFQSLVGQHDRFKKASRPQKSFQIIHAVDPLNKFR
ncbi:MAG: hypothetical protein ACJAVK_003531 [Akkermansiaceae bacterium]|jgi:hypothetical protein